MHAEYLSRDNLAKTLLWCSLHMYLSRVRIRASTRVRVTTNQPEPELSYLHIQRICPPCNKQLLDKTAEINMWLRNY